MRRAIFQRQKQRIEHTRCASQRDEYPRCTLNIVKLQVRSCDRNTRWFKLAPINAEEGATYNVTIGNELFKSNNVSCNFFHRRKNRYSRIVRREENRMQESKEAKETKRTFVLFIYRSFLPAAGVCDSFDWTFAYPRGFSFLLRALTEFKVVSDPAPLKTQIKPGENPLADKKVRKKSGSKNQARPSVLIFPLK